MAALIVSTLVIAGVANANPFWRPKLATTLEPNVYTATAASDVYAAQATAPTTSFPKHYKRGKAFDRFLTIWLENTDFSKAAADPNLAWLATKGITLENYHGVTHPSEPNYVAAVGGDTFGIDNDAFIQIDGNVSTVVDLLEDRGISWGTYQEDMPYSGFEGFAWRNQETQANDYVRKHHPPIIYNANTSPLRLSYQKNLTQFHTDLANDQLPQWMFITPNMTSDGHDSSVTVAGAWTRNFLEPLLADPTFTDRTLILITFDENHSYTLSNKIFSILLGDAVPSHLQGTTDPNFYNHYSEIATVEANWNLHTLGRWDVGANVFDVVAKHTGDVVRPYAAATAQEPEIFFNSSYAGPFNTAFQQAPYPAPNLEIMSPGTHRSVLPAIKKAWRNSGLSSYYTDSVEVPDGQHPPKGYAYNDVNN